ncbi:protein of unknown function DUF107 [Ferroglobus placidus DSM 10642]|uniref:Uncharacterized protein n=1 Tax=Ferroglobus placidus (strain DSM 10642 / AEDII12DO) TaxID=589924 RepID=D3RWS5_FERPA|nr:nodulation protein NfeD [Ferroglobus placidus]ADC64938.1 protein of unknown function DUF107 [Ferroglobus placidus DSM 10642]
MRKLLPILLLLLIAKAEASKVVEVRIEGAINEGTVIKIERAFKIAEEENADAILITLDTPGGLVKSTEKIVSMILSSKIPVVTYVYPQGAFSASAGSIILIAGHVAAMSEGTSVGAATPIAVGVEGTKVEEKAVKYLASYVKSIAEKRGRNATAIEKFVTEAYSLSAKEALKYNVIDVIANSKEELFEKINGWEVEVNGEKVRLNLERPEIIYVENDLRGTIYDFITNPEIASILLILGIYLLIFGLTSPGYIPETLGAIFLILALAGLGVMQINYLGALLILLAIIFLIAELITPTYGFLAAASIFCFVLGMLMLINEPMLPEKFYSEARNFVLGVAIGTALIMTFAIVKISQLRKERKKIGGEAIIGKRGEVISVNKRAFAKIGGEIWEVVCGEKLEVGDEVEVVGREGLKLKVVKVGGRRT